MKSLPLVSTVIPTYNRAHTIRRAIESALQQTYSPMEVIVVDDGSTDNTESVLTTFRNSVRVVRQANAGAAAARNRGTQEAGGEIITFLDSDDLWHPECVATHVEALQKAPKEVPCSLVNGWLNFSNGRRITSFENSSIDNVLRSGLILNMPDILASRFIMFCQFIAIRRSALAQTQGFDEDVSFMEDYGLPLRLSVLGPWVFNSRLLVVWNQGTPGSLSISQRAMANHTALLDSLLVIRRRFIEAIRDDRRFENAKEIQLRELHYNELELKAISLRNAGRQLASAALLRSIRVRRRICRSGRTFPKATVQALAPQGIDG